MAAQACATPVLMAVRTCLQLVRQRLSAPQFVPGQHVKVAPKEAAVLIPLYEDTAGVVRVVLTERSRLLNSHAGEVALPGGKRDPEDANSVATALREADEELRLESADVEVIAQLPPVLSKHCLSVTPVVGIISEPVYQGLVPAPDEVDRVFSVPLHHFLEDHERHTFADAELGGHTYRIHHFAEGVYDVWGLTAGILIYTAELAFDRKAAFDVIGSGMDYTKLQFDGRCVSLRRDSRRRSAAVNSP